MGRGGLAASYLVIPSSHPSPPVPRPPVPLPSLAFRDLGQGAELGAVINIRMMIEMRMSLL